MDNNTNQVDIKKWYEQLINVYGIAKCSITIADKMLKDYDNKITEQALKTIIINALYFSATINICKIIDNEQLGIRRFHNNYYRMTKKEKFQFDEQAFNRLKNRRNQSLAHFDTVNLDEEIEKALPLYINDLHSLIQSVENELFPLSKDILGGCLVGKKNGSNEWYFALADQVEKEYDLMKNWAEECQKFTLLTLKQNSSESLSS